MPFLKNSKIQNKGFTLIEMIVAIGILLVITGIVIFNYNGFNSDLSLTNLAYDMALTFRQAEFYGIGVKGATGASTAAPYGILITGDTSYKLMRDINNSNKLSDDVSDDAMVQSFVLTRGNLIKSAVLSTGATCSIPSILFVRPLPTVYISCGSGDSAQSNVDLVITLKSQKSSKEIQVVILRTGQISVKKI